MKQLKLGIIGAGHIFWSNHRKNLLKMEDIEIVAVCDPSEDSRKRAEEEFGAQTFEGVDALLASGIVLDALLNFSPPFARKDAIQAAAHMGVPIFVEKPVAKTVVEAMEILEIVHESSVLVSVGFMFRYMPGVERLVGLLKGKKVTHINSEFLCPAITKWGIPGWFLKKEVSGGPIVDQAIHLFDLLRYVVGDITQVASFEANIVKERDEECTIEDSSSTILKFSNGVTGSHIQSWVHDIFGGSITIRTEQDRLTLDLVDGSLKGEVKGEVYEYTLSKDESESTDHYREMDVFLQAVREDDFSSVKSSFKDATLSLAVAEAVNAAMSTNKTVKVEVL